MNQQNCSISDGRLIIESDGSRVALDGSVLRNHCRCAECRALVLNDVQLKHEDISVTAATPLGYGLQLHFSDGHNRGVFPWSYLGQIATALQP